MRQNNEIKDISRISVFIGIDPGINGGFSLLTLDNTLVLGEIPYVEIKLKSNKKRKEIDSRSLYEILKNRIGFAPMTLGAIENVHSIFGVGKQSAFQMGYNTGMLKSILDVLCNNVEKVIPSKWQSYMWQTYKCLEDDTKKCSKLVFKKSLHQMVSENKINKVILYKNQRKKGILYYNYKEYEGDMIIEKFCCDNCSIKDGITDAYGIMMYLRHIS